MEQGLLNSNIINNYPEEMKVKKEDYFPYAFSASAGVIMWITICLISGRSEAWDTPLYWTTGYPVLAVVLGGIGFIAPHKAWRWPLTAMITRGFV